MSTPAPHQTVSSVAALIERYEPLRAVLDWLSARFAPAPASDDAIDWEDGEEHDEPHGPATL